MSEGDGWLLWYPLDWEVRAIQYPVPLGNPGSLRAACDHKVVLGMGVLIELPAITRTQSPTNVVRSTAFTFLDRIHRYTTRQRIIPTRPLWCVCVLNAGGIQGQNMDAIFRRVQRVYDQVLGLPQDERKRVYAMQGPRQGLPRLSHEPVRVVEA